MTLNPQVAQMLAAMAEAPPIDFENSTAQQVRAAYDAMIFPGEPIAMARVEDVAIPLAGRSLAARLYIPEGAGEAPPLTLFFHGGGWVLGNLDTHDASCRALARASGVALLALDYRLAPEHRYPAAADDCHDALCWVVENGTQLGIDPSRLAVAGDSAGGNLAAVTALQVRDRGGPALRHQLLIYPVTARDFTTPSYVANGGGEYFLSKASMRWFWDHYAGGIEDAPLADILGTPDLSGLAPATVITAEYDPLRDEGDRYAVRLAEQGVAVDAACAPGMIHGFFSMFQMVPAALEWIERGGANLRAALSD
ncbi:MAG: alpha/beta hydrolase [Sphingomonadaceae bacterium]|nr:alpha/beta hydrolase [Sphingomonadaceae bacterium]